MGTQQLIWKVKLLYNEDRQNLGTEALMHYVPSCITLVPNYDEINFIQNITSILPSFHTSKLSYSNQHIFITDSKFGTVFSVYLHHVTSYLTTIGSTVHYPLIIFLRFKIHII